MSVVKSAVVTGAGGSLGRAICRRLGDDGFCVAPLDLPGEGLAETVRLLEGDGTVVHPLEVDLRDVTSLRWAVRSAESALGPVLALINNAAVYPSKRFLDISVDEFRDVVSVNETGYFVAAQEAARLMCDRGRGAIVNVASITWHGGWQNLASYVTTKGASVAMTRALARELGPSNVRVNGVSPGAFPTKAEEIHEDPQAYSEFVLEHQALKRRGTPEELAAVVSFLVGDDAGFMTGQTLNVDGGWVME